MGSPFSRTWALGQGRTRRISEMPPQENDSGSQANVRISNTKEDKAKVDKSIFWDMGFRPGTDGMHLPNAASGKHSRISGKCPDLKYQRGIGKRGQDGSPNCRLRKTSVDLRQMSGSQIPKRIRQKGTSTKSGTWDGTDLPNAASGKRPRISGKCPDLKYQRG